MSSRGKRATSPSPVKAKKKARAARLGPPAPAPFAMALLIVIACGVPFVIWGNPYPPDVLQYWLVGGVAVLAVAAASQASVFRGVRDGAQRVADFVLGLSPLVFALSVGALTCFLSIVLAMYAFRGRPSTSDEVATLWHARMLLHGHLSLPVDPNREFFALETVVDTGRWYSQFPIGGPLMLVVGAAIGLPWIVNPVLAGGSAAALYHFARRAFGEVQGRACATLFALTPMVLFMAGTWMNHVPVLFLTTCALALLVEWDRTTSRRDALITSGGIGIAVGGIATIRPLDAVVVALVVGVYQLVTLKRLAWRAERMIVQVLFGTLAVSVLLVANRATAGHPLTFGYDVSWGAGHRVGFHTDPYGNAHTPQHALELAMQYMGELSVFSMDWPLPALALVVVGLLAMRRPTRWDILLMGLFVAQVLAYAAYWGEGEFLGPRFMYTALPAIAVLIARAPFVLGDQIGTQWAGRIGSVIIACSVVTWCVPLSSASVWGLATQASHTRLALRADVEGAVRKANLTHALVFIREPFRARLARRLWGVGVQRSAAAQLLDTRDGCSLLSTVQAAESDSTGSAATRSARIARDAAPFTAGPQSIEPPNEGIHISSRASLTPDCQRELDDDTRLPSAAFGPGLALEPIDRQGHVNGNVIYLADLGDHNTVLRRRFGDRTWYRLAVRQTPDGQAAVSVQPY